MHFQELILSLQHFWSRQGCLILQPYDTEKGAATFNAATFLRSLGPEPFNAAYVEPCRRPADGRYGDNPIRLQHYYQFQVVMKPSPPDIIDKYLQSLFGIGIDPRDHDIRLVHDDWESPTLGAWGLGWEVWVDGMEITQFTYFQQVGGCELNPIMGEITYGLERICLFLAKKNNVFELDYNENFTYGELFHQNEVQFSRYNFELADVQMLLELFHHYATECSRLNESACPIPAMDYCLKASHAFNLLDARGAISVSERQNYILQVRALAKHTAQTWLSNRETLGFPLLKSTLIPDSLPQPSVARSIAEEQIQCGTNSPVSSLPLLIEIGIEEMPAQVIPSLLTILPKLIEKHLINHSLTLIDPQIFVTPRRIVISITEISLKQPDTLTTIKGPPLRLAKDHTGNWTKAASGFAAKNNGTVADLYVKESDNDSYVYIENKQIGLPTSVILSQNLPLLLKDIPWYKTMRWGNNSVPFVRPIKWITALLGTEIVAIEFAAVKADKFSYGHRFLHPQHILMSAAREDYLTKLRQAFVIVDHHERETLIRRQIEEIASANGLQWREDPELLREVTHLVEFPIPILCRFPEKYLTIPEIVLISEMKKHQKFFALHHPSKALANSYIAISNNQCRDMDIVSNGYTKVLLSRFADAEFFLSEDKKIHLSERVKRLEGLIFYADLGTIQEKVERIIELSDYLTRQLGLSESAMEQTRQIAQLCKTDLTTLMVGEFPALQGEMGRHYALQEGLPNVVADGIRDHYLPHSLADDYPQSPMAAIVGIADRIDTLVGIIGIGKMPKGSADPYAVRRAALTAIAIILRHGFQFNLADVISQSLRLYERILSQIKRDTLHADILEFIFNRLEGLFHEDSPIKTRWNFPTDLIRAIVNASTPWYNLTKVLMRLEALEQFRGREDYYDLTAAFKRANNIIKNLTITGAVNPDGFSETEELELWNSYKQVKDRISTNIENEEYLAALAEIATLKNPVDRFFDKVRVNDDDPAKKANRQNLVKNIVSLLSPLADFTQLQDRPE